MKRLALALACLPSAALADGYSGHRGVELFTKKPCTQAIAAIDTVAEVPKGMGLADMVDYSSVIGLQIAAQGMAWGFLLGFDTANGGLQGPEETTLIRLRKACAADPTATALDLLSSFKQP